MTAPKMGATFELIGHPVGHSLSPAIHGAAYAALGTTENRYTAVDCPDEAAVRRQVDALRRGEIAGANVTVPWKKLALELADEAHASARDVGAANVLTAVGNGPNRRIVAHNTDVGALSDELARGRPGARAATVIGSGGAALAAVAACRALGIERIAVVARSFRGKRSSGWKAADALEALGAAPVAWPGDAGAASDFRRAVVSSDVVVQSTSDGMRGATSGTDVRDVVPWKELAPTTYAYDLVYNPAVTPFVAAARAYGLRADSGLGMLVGQAVLAIELWLGRRPEGAPLLAAAERVLSEKFPE
jgi:shikimate dehydrogenase